MIGGSGCPLISARVYYSGFWKGCEQRRGLSPCKRIGLFASWM